MTVPPADLAWAPVIVARSLTEVPAGTVSELPLTPAPVWVVVVTVGVSTVSTSVPQVLVAAWFWRFPE